MDLLRNLQELVQAEEEARDFKIFIAPEGEDDDIHELEVVLQDIIDHYTCNIGDEDEYDEACQVSTALQAYFGLRESMHLPNIVATVPPRGHSYTRARFNSGLFYCPIGCQECKEGMT
jgi:hypothetical protein